MPGLRVRAELDLRPGPESRDPRLSLMTVGEPSGGPSAIDLGRIDRTWGTL